MTLPTRSNPATTTYRRPIDRLTGRYTVAWHGDVGQREVQAHTRFTDLEGHLPSLYSAAHLPRTLRTWWQVKRAPILAEPVPFLVYDAIRHLRRTVGAGTRVLEIGGGNSTLWFLARGATVTTVESAESWASLVADTAAQWHVDDRLDLRVLTGTEAERSVDELPDGSYDVLLVDSDNAHNWRTRFVDIGKRKVRAGGLVVLDNSDHPNCWGARALMGEEGMRFTGYPPMALTVCQTTIWQV